MENQIIILMDDSGKLNKNETACIYGGLFFFSKKDYVSFINKYKSIIKSIRSKYYTKSNGNYPEIKGTTKLEFNDKKRILNLLRKQHIFGVFINNQKIYKNIMNNNLSRGRYTDYAQKLIIKKIIYYAINQKMVSPYKRLNLTIKIDNSIERSNGYYNLNDSIYMELVKGIINYNRQIYYKPILHKGININLNFYDSKKHFGIQSADMLANYLHRKYKYTLLNNIEKDVFDFVDVKLFLP